MLTLREAAFQGAEPALGQARALGPEPKLEQSHPILSRLPSPACCESRPRSGGQGSVPASLCETRGGVPKCHGLPPAPPLRCLLGPGRCSLPGVSSLQQQVPGGAGGLGGADIPALGDLEGSPARSLTSPVTQGQVPNLPEHALPPRGRDGGRNRLLRGPQWGRRVRALLGTPAAMGVAVTLRSAWRNRAAESTPGLGSLVASPRSSNSW